MEHEQEQKEKQDQKERDKALLDKEEYLDLLMEMQETM